MKGWQKGLVEWTEGRDAYLSVVFSWDTLKAVARACHYRQLGYSVHVGGPGVFAMGKHLRSIADVGGSKCSRGGSLSTEVLGGSLTMSPASGQTWRGYEDAPGHTGEAQARVCAIGNEPR